ncbi:MAG: hypothetical protein M1305_03205 [Candidatus Marsarchaeota archaeon]|nr:hypothetical protein [Candidatus Marsarchaeota archaeon]
MQVSLDSVRLAGKPLKHEYVHITKRIQAADIEIEEFRTMVLSGYTWSPCIYRDNYRKNDCFLGEE